MKIAWTSALLLIAVAAHAAPPQIQFQPGGVVASGISPAGQVAWFSVAREATGAGSQIVRRESVIADDDADGVVRLDLGKPVPTRSIWAAVDLKTGEYALATPEGYPLRQVTFAPATIRPGVGGGVDRLDLDGREIVEIFVARPAVGAWALTLWDGAEGDEDGPANRRISGALSRLEPVGASPAPPAVLEPGDVIVMMDANTLQVAALRLPGGAR